MYKKLIIILLVIQTVLMCSCSNDKKKDDKTTDPGTDAHGTTVITDTTAPEPETKYLDIIKDGKSDFRIIRSETSFSTLTKAGTNLYNTIKDKTKAKLKYETDWSNKPSVCDFSVPEIIIGHIKKYSESKEFLDSIEPLSFRIKANQNKIFIAGSSDTFTSRAVQYFIDEYINNEKYCVEGMLRIPADLDITVGPIEYDMKDLINKNDTYTTEIEPLIKIKRVDGFSGMQGGCTDGKYCYFGMVNSSLNKSYIYKYKISTWELVKRSEPLPLDHCNDMCYNPDTNQIVVVHNAPRRNIISIVDPETLTIIEDKDIKINIFSMSYNQKRHMYIVGLSGGQNFAALKSNFKYYKQYIVDSTGYTTQGMECDDDFIYFIQYNENVIMIYDWDGNFITRVDTTLENVEPENISRVGDEFYVGCNNSNWTGGIVYRLKINKVN